MTTTNEHFGKIKKKLQTNTAVNGLYDTRQSSVIRIIHRNAGLKRFFDLQKFLLLLLAFAYIYISQGSVETHLPCGGYTIITLLQIVHRVCQWKNFDNRSIIGKNTDKSKVARFLMAHSVHS